MADKWTDRPWVLDLRKRLTALAGVVAIVGSVVVLLSLGGLLGNQGGGEGIEDALVLETPPAAGLTGLEVGPQVGKLALLILKGLLGLPPCVPR